MRSDGNYLHNGVFRLKILLIKTLKKLSIKKVPGIVINSDDNLFSVSFWQIELRIWKHFTHVLPTRTFTTWIISKQECIPVGCVPSAAVAVCWGVSVRGWLSRDVSVRGMSILGGVCPGEGWCMVPGGVWQIPPPSHGQHSWHITFPQLRLRTVSIYSPLN